MTTGPKRIVYRCEWCRGEVTEDIEHVPGVGDRGRCVVCGQTVTLLERHEPGGSDDAATGYYDAEAAESTVTLVLNRPDGTRLALDLADPNDHAAPDFLQDCECGECAAYWAVHKLAMEVPDDFGRWRELPPDHGVHAQSRAWDDEGFGARPHRLPAASAEIGR